MAGEKNAGIERIRAIPEEPINLDVETNTADSFTRDSGELPQANANANANRESGLPQIEYKEGETGRISREAEQALIDAGESIYQQGQRLVRPVRPADAEGAGLHEVSRVWLRERMEECAAWRYHDGRKGRLKAINAPLGIADQVLAHVGQWPFCTLRGVIGAPTLRPDGTVLDKPGYDPATRLIFDPAGAEFGRVPEAPTLDDAKAAAAALYEPISQMPFVGEGDKSAALASLLTVTVRPNLPTAPAFAFTAPTKGSGKSKLMDCASILAIGARASVIDMSSEKEELRKVIDSALLQSSPVIALDNLTQPLSGARLCQVTTQERMAVRRLGTSDQFEIPVTSTVFATGNNLRVKGDMTRRVVLCRLDPQMENPETRDFEFDPLDVVARDRGRLVTAALTILRSYQHAGRPGARTDYGSFEDWSALVRSALLWLGFADPLGPACELKDSDPEKEVAEGVLEALFECFGPNQFTSKQAADRAKTKRDSGDEEMFDALHEVCGEYRDLKTKRLGNWLDRQQDRIISGKRIEFYRKYSNRTQWVIREVQR